MSEYNTPAASPAHLEAKSFRVVWFDLDNYLVRWTPWYATEQQALDAAIEREKRRPSWAIEYTRSMQSRPF